VLQVDAVNGLSLSSGQVFSNVLTFTPGDLQGLFGALEAGGKTGNGACLNLGNGLTLGALYNVAAGNVTLEVVATPVTTADSWTGGTGNWNTPADWTVGVPTFCSDVTIGGASSVVTLSQDATIDSLTMSSGGTLQAGGSSLTVGGAVTIQAGAALTAKNLNVGGSFTDDGGVTISGGTLDLLKSGTIGATGTLALTGGASISTPITFSGTGGTLQVDSASDSVTGAISGFATGDYIDARFMPFTSEVMAQWQENAAGTAGTLTLSNGIGTSMTFNLNGDYLVSNFDVLSDGSGGTLVTVTASNPKPSASTTVDMIMRDSSSFEIYDIGGNAILAAYPMGQVGTQWQVAGLGGFNGADTSDVMLRNSSTGAFDIYDVSNNNMTSFAAIGAVGLEWTVAGFGDFSGNAGETDMLMRNSNTGEFAVYDISKNNISGYATFGPVGLEWTVAGFGDFSGNANETDMLMRNSNTGAFEVYDISHNAITSAAAMGAVGSEWTVAGFGDFTATPAKPICSCATATPARSSTTISATT
jgi:hypothetical protein